MCLVRRFVCQVIEGGTDDTGHAHGIRLDCSCFLFHVEGGVLITDARTVKNEVHLAAHLADELQQTFRSIRACHVHLFGSHDIEVRA